MEINSYEYLHRNIYFFFGLQGSSKSDFLLQQTSLIEEMAWVSFLFLIFFFTSYAMSLLYAKDKFK